VILFGGDMFFMLYSNYLNIDFYIFIMFLKKILFFSVLCISFVALLPQAAYAGDPKLPINDDSYAARYVSQSVPDPIKIEAGGMKTVEFTFKNTGSATWSESGSRYISAYAVEPKYRSSDFAGSEWLSTKQTGKIAGVVRPGETGKLTLTLYAPEKTGEYVERFYLAAENRTWVSGGYFYIKIRVVPKTAVKTSVDDKKVSDLEIEEVADEVVTQKLQAKKVGQNKKSVTAVGGEQVSMVLIYQNKSTAPWEGYQLGVNNPSSLASSNKLTFADKKWYNNLVVESSAETVELGAFARKRFTFRAPVKKGTYKAQFHVAVGGEIVEGSEAVVNIEVTADAPDHYTAPVFTGAPVVTPTVKTYRIAAEPRIRVGVWKVDESYVMFQSAQDDYKIYTGNVYHGILPVNTKATLSRVNGQYSLKAGDISIKSPEYIRLVPKKNEHAVFSLLNYDRKVSWKGPRNFNTYRGAMEYRLTQDNKTMYAINDLLFEDYVAGIAENTDASPSEYLKSQAVAQRTYAYYITTFSNKHEKRHFDVVAHTGDQLYLGYESEQIMPRFVTAAKATRGYMATYDVDDNKNTPNDVVITPYFGHTDGRTRSWTEVWGGSTKPWLVSVKSEYDAGRRLYGHGVGMSQRDAAIRADKEGLGWEALIKHYYTGVDLEQLYK
jgi:hypothetical protein